jgi:hypothetical protein
LLFDQLQRGGVVVQKEAEQGVALLEHGVFLG